MFLRRGETGDLYLGFTSVHSGSGWSFGVQSAEFRAWLPANSTSTTATSTTNATRTLDADRSASPQKEPQRFLLDDPDNPSVLNIAGTTDTGNVAARQESGVRTRVAAQQSGVPSVTVEHIRSRAAAVEREYNGGDGLSGLPGLRGLQVRVAQPGAAEDTAVRLDALGRRNAADAVRPAGPDDSVHDRLG